MHSEETKRKLSEAQKGEKNHMFGKKLSEERKAQNRAYRHTEDAKKRMSETRKRKGIRPPSWLGKHLSEEHKKKVAASNRKRHPNYRGEKHWNWKGGVTSMDEKIRKSFEYKLWRTAVFERDNYTCIWCGKRGVVLNADHIKRFADYPELRFALDNGRTLCVPCHKTTDTYGRKSHGR